MEHDYVLQKREMLTGGMSQSFKSGGVHIESCAGKEANEGLAEPARELRLQISRLNEDALDVLEQRSALISLNDLPDEVFMCDLRV